MEKITGKRMNHAENEHAVIWKIARCAVFTVLCLLDKDQANVTGPASPKETESLPFEAMEFSFCLSTPYQA